MTLKVSFSDITSPELLDLCQAKKDAGWRFTQMLCVNTDNGVDCIYSFAHDAELENYIIRGVGKNDHLPSVSPIFFSAFVFENEAHDLFGVNIDGIVIDFEGHFYNVAIDEPMTVLSPQKRAEKEKAAKLAAAKARAAKAADAKADDVTDASISAKAPAVVPTKDKRSTGTTDSTAAEMDLEAEIARKTAGLDPDKAAKIEAALRRKYEMKKAQG